MRQTIELNQRALGIKTFTARSRWVEEEEHAPKLSELTSEPLAHYSPAASKRRARRAAWRAGEWRRERVAVARISSVPIRAARHCVSAACSLHACTRGGAGIERAWGALPAGG